MAWRNLVLTVDAACVDELTDLLERCGASAVTARGHGDEGDVLEPDPGATPMWERVRLEAMFDRAHPPNAVVAALRAWHRDRSVAVPDIDLVDVAEEDWSTTWRRFAAPMTFGARLSVVPRDFGGAVSGVALRLDPGMAFGTGSHPTTALCLEWIASHDLRGASVVDFGCGSGVLGIAALLLGAASVRAIDHDPQARLATRENAAYNGVGAALVIEAPQASVRGRHDVVLANILADPLIALAPTLTGLLRPGGTILLSGLRQDQWDAVGSAYPGFRFEAPVVRDGWVAIEGIRCA
jgi:ribosomal protein L11 methyltransferase